MKPLPNLVVPTLSFVAGSLTSLVVASCVSGPSSAGRVPEYNTALAAAHRIPTVAAGSAEAEAALGRWKNLLADLTYDALRGQVLAVYADSLYFNDTLKTLRTGAAVEDHLLSTGKLLDSGSVEYRTEFRDSLGDYYVRWEMRYAGPKLNGGEPIVTVGMSQLRFDEDGKVIFHQDYWDSTSGVFEHLPVVGGPLRWLRARM